MPTPGESVEVLIPLTGSWVGGFVVVDDHGDKLSLQRVSDGAVLPASVPAPSGPPGDPAEHALVAGCRVAFAGKHP